MFSFIRKFILWLVGLIIFLFSAAFVLAWVYEDEIKDIAIAKLNEQLKSEISVGHVSFSVIAHFPYASITFPDVTIKESYQGSDKNVLEAQEISLLFNMLDIYKENYRIKKIYVASGTLKACVNAKGEANYDILKTKEESNGKFSINIEAIRMVDMRIIYAYQPLQQYYDAQVHDALLNGNFTNDRFDLGIDVDAMVNKISIKKTNYIAAKPVKAKLQLAIDNEQKIYRFTGGQLNLPELPLTINGMVQVKKAGIYSDLEIKGQELTIQSFLAQLPARYAESIGQYSSKGNFSFLMQLKGLTTDSLSPKVLLTAGIDHAEITAEEYGTTLENVSLSANYSNGDKHCLESSSLSISNIKASMDNRLIQASVEVKDFSNPYLQLDLQADLDLKKFSRFLPASVVEDAGGNVLANVHIQGLVEELKNSSVLSMASTSGSVKLINVHVKTKGYPLDFENINASLTLKGTSLAVEGFSGKVANIAIQLNGSIDNFLSLLSSQQQLFQGRFAISTPYVNLQEFLALTQGEQKDSLETFNIAPKLDLHINASIGAMDFDKFKGKNLKVEFTVKDQVARAEYFSVNTMEGGVEGKFSVDAADKKLIYINAEAAIRSVNIKSLFAQCNNFGQAILVDKNLKGDLTANVSFSSIWTKKLDPLLDKIYAKSNVLIENGELNDFEPLMALSRYVDVNELKNLKFATLQNQIIIEDKTVYIPLMNVENNALNLSITGQHTFDNDVNYKIRILFSELLKKRLKVRQRMEEFGPVEDDGAGKTTLFLKMTGKATSPKISLDRESMRSKVKDDLGKEGKQVKQILADEFKNIFKGGNVVVQSADGKADWENDIPRAKSEVKIPKTEAGEAKAKETETVSPAKEKQVKKNKALQEIENDLNKGEDDQ